MNSTEHTLSKIVQQEEQFGLYNYKIFNIPIWRLVRFKIRTSFLCKESGFQNKTIKSRFSVFNMLKNFIISLKRFIYFCFFYRKNIDNLVFAFPRLSKVNGEYFDKFTDPVIDQSKIKDSFLIFQRCNQGVHKSPRLNNDFIIITDFIDFSSRFLGLVFSPLVLIVFLLKDRFIFLKKIKLIFNITKIQIFGICVSTSSFFFSYIAYRFVFRRLKAKSVFVVSREVFFPAIAAAKSLNISVNEFQHGVTCGKTVLYTGLYDNYLDPNSFLTFGTAWNGTQFGIPMDRIINIGWAYKKFVYKYNNDVFSDNVMLVLSSPDISDKILEATVVLAEHFKEYVFHIRLHPQESLTSQQINVIRSYNNISLRSNEIESSIVISSYKSLLGENTSVLYEGLSLGKKVGRLGICGLKPIKLKNSPETGFFNINCLDDFNIFCNNKEDVSEDLNMYSNFNPIIVNSL